MFSYGNNLNPTITARMAAGHVTWPWPMNGLLYQQRTMREERVTFMNLHHQNRQSHITMLHASCCINVFILKGSVYMHVFSVKAENTCMYSQSRLLESQWGGSCCEDELNVFQYLNLLFPSSLLGLSPSFPLGLQPPAWEMKPHTGAAARIEEEEEEAVGEEDDNAGSGSSQNTSQQPSWMWWSCQIT